MSDMMTFDEFDKDWQKRHRASVPRKAKTSSGREYFWIAFWLVVATGAAIFSAAHTIPAAEMTIFSTVPSRGYLAITAFIIVELVIFGASAMRREIHWLVWLLTGAVLVALAGNVSSSIRAVAENGGDFLNQFGGVLLAIIAPITALAAGEVLHIQLDRRNAKRLLAQADYEAKYREMEAKINAAYSKYVKEHEPKVEPVETRQVVGSFRQLPTIAHPTPKMKKTLAHLREHPEDMETESRALASRIGVSHTLVNEAKKHIKVSANGHSANGHGGEG